MEHEMPEHVVHTKGKSLVGILHRKRKLGVWWEVELAYLER
jgi:hypothetical protein